MTFIQTVAEEQAEGDTAALYAQSRDESGHIPNFVKAFSHRPGVMSGFDQLLGSIKENMDLRRYELITIAAAKELRCSYCMLAHGSVLLRNFFNEGQLREIAEDADRSDLDEKDKAIMRFAAKVVRDATSVTVDDIEGLKGHGLTDPEIFDVAAAASVRCFIGKVADAMGALPDPAFARLAPDVRKALVVGRPISE